MDKIEVTQADREAATSLMSDVGLFSNVLTAKAVRAFARHRLATSTDATPVAWMPIESAPKGVPTEDVGCRCESEWFLGKPSGKYPQSAPFIVICRRAWPQDDSWKDAGDTHYRPDYFSEWCPIETSHPPATDVAALVEQRCPSCGVKFREIAGIAVMAAATSFRASQIESLAHRKAEDD